MKRVQVCKKQTFIEILGVSKDRVQNVCKTFFQSGTMPADKRGGDKRSARRNKRNALKEFIKSVKGIENITAGQRMCTDTI